MKNTLVQFRIDKEGGVFAFFPNLPEWPEDRLRKLNATESMKNELRQLFASYAHVGQHSVCCTNYFNECEPATEEQYIPLLNELVDIGYTDLKPIN